MFMKTTVMSYFLDLENIDVLTNYCLFECLKETQ